MQFQHLAGAKNAAAIGAFVSLQPPALKDALRLQNLKVQSLAPAAANQTGRPMMFEDSLIEKIDGIPALADPF